MVEREINKRFLGDRACSVHAPQGPGCEGMTFRFAAQQFPLSHEETGKESKELCFFMSERTPWPGATQNTDMIFPLCLVGRKRAVTSLSLFTSQIADVHWGNISHPLRCVTV